ncbi:DHH family phosphoesterase [Salinarchaeum laminariae]|uniref:DHH family phosphoesterase n=1 Tax=Salinarchaeum laminariae TaxID=869888 RepID=UPI0020C04C4A|nr:phosphohydrolase [Salinarchaeum laminariae]
MDDDLIDDRDLPPERRSLLPGEGFFIPDSFEEEIEAQEAANALEGVSVAVVADPDADGLACVALLREVYGEAALVPASPHDLEDGMAYVAEYGEDDIRAFVCDLCPDRFEYVEGELGDLLATASEVRWFDHHQWDDDVAASVRDAGVDLVVGDSDEECTADVALRSLDYEFPDHLRELAEVTRDHDLWIKEDDRSDDISDYSYWVDEAETYVEVVREHGPDLPEETMTMLEERRVEKQDLIERALRRAEFKDIGPWTVGVTYGRCSQNEVAEGMREEGADASVIVKPSGPASIRGTEEFQRAHEVAGKVNGGGHPKAAGCKPDVYDDMMDYAHHWTTQGAVTKQAIVDAFREVADEAEAEDDEAAADSDDS